MASRSNQQLGRVCEASRLIRSRSESQSSGGFENQRGNRGGGSRGSGHGNRSRRSRNSRHRGGSSRGRHNDTYHHEELPSHPDDWEKKVESEGIDAYLDLALALAGTGIPYLEGMADDFIDPNSVAGQEVQGLLLASIRSMRTGYVVNPDGTQGRKIKSSLIRDETARTDAGGE